MADRPGRAAGPERSYGPSGTVGWASTPVPGSRHLPVVGLACSQDIRQRYVDPYDLQQLEAVAEFRFNAFDLGSGLNGPAPRVARPRK